MAGNDTSKKFSPLRGRAEITLENGNRFLAPKDMREALGRDFVLWVSPTGCLVAQTATAFEGLELEITRGDPFGRGCDILRRFIYPNSAAPINFDDQGRLVIPTELRGPAKLGEEKGKKILVLGCFDRMEMWSPEEYIRYDANKQQHNADRWSDFEAARAAVNAGPQRVHPVEEAIKRMGRG